MDRKIKGVFSGEKSEDSSTPAKLKTAVESAKCKIEAAFSTVRNNKDFIREKVLPPAVLFLVSIITSGTHLALGVYPLGVSLLCAAGNFIGGIAVLSGLIFNSFNMGIKGVFTLGISSAAFVFSMCLGALGYVRTNAVKKQISKAGFNIRDSPGNDAFSKLDLYLQTSPKVKTAVALAAALLIGLCNIISGDNLWYDIFGSALGAVIIPIFTFAFSSIKNEGVHISIRKAGVCAVAFSVVFSIADFTVGGMNAAVVIALVSCFCVSYTGGAENGALYGIFVGMALSPSFSAMYALAAVVSGALFSVSNGVATLTGTVLAVSWALYADGMNALSEVVPEIILSAAVFYPAVYFGILPTSFELFDAIGKSEKKGERGKITGSGGVSERLKSICMAMSRMSDTLGELSKRMRVPSNSETYAICGNAVKEVCTKCAKYSICLRKQSICGASSGELKHVVKILRNRGKIGANSFSEGFLRDCRRTDEIICGINGAFSEFFKETVQTDKVSVVAKDYAAISDMISEAVVTEDREQEKNQTMTDSLADSLDEYRVSYDTVSIYGTSRPRVFVRGLRVKDLTFGSEDMKNIIAESVGMQMCEPEMSIDYDRLNLYSEPVKCFAAKHGSYSERGGEESNGDSVNAFRCANGDECLLICDGMGSGRDASITSRISSIFIEKMMNAGVSAESTLRMLNNFQRERRIECFSTVDLLIVDLFTGKARFIKSGAASSFVLRGNKIFRIETESMPIGILNGLSAKEVEFELCDGDTVIMMSDGMLGDSEDISRFYDAVSENKNSENLNDAAKRLVRYAKEEESVHDDVTVAMMKIRKIG